MPSTGWKAIVLAVVWLLETAAAAAGEQRERQSSISFSFAVIYLPRPEKDAVACVRGFCETELKGIAVRTEEPEVPGGISVAAEVIPVSEFGSPEAAALEHFGRGLSRREQERLQRTEQVLMLNFSGPAAQVMKLNQLAAALTLRVAESDGALPYDMETREYFSRAAWKEWRIESWQGDLPQVELQVTIHAYPHNDLIREITLGMKKFGRPDIVASGVARSSRSSMGSLLNAACQTLLEVPGSWHGKELTVDLEKIQNRRQRAKLTADLRKGATKRAKLTLASSRREDGDPLNELLELTFGGVKGSRLQERQEALLASLFGAEDSIVSIEHDPEILAASQGARKKLQSLRQRFQKGLAPGEVLLLKAPFKVPAGGNEYMWVEVVNWEGESIAGLLSNDPVDIPDLEAGARVSIKEADVFDYLLRRADGGTEGNETGKLILKKSR